MAEQYLRKLIYADLNERNAKVVIAKLRKFDWVKDEVSFLHYLLLPLFELLDPLNVTRTQSRFHGDEIFE